MATCTATGTWDAVINPSDFSEQQWQAANILILCQILAAFNGDPVDMSLCTVDGVWNAVQNAAYKSKQQFMAENIFILCQILTAVGGGAAGTGAVLHGSGPPAGLTPGVAGKLYYDDDTGLLYEQAADGSWPSPS